MNEHPIKRPQAGHDVESRKMESCDNQYSVQARRSGTTDLPSLDKETISSDGPAIPSSGVGVAEWPGSLPVLLEGVKDGILSDDA